AGRDPGRDLLQPLRQRDRALHQPAGRVRRRVFRDPVAPARREGARLMAAGVQTRERGRRRRRPMADINVTPVVDAMLGLLIVFMVTAPLLTVGVPVDLPKTKAQALSQDREPLSITVKRGGQIYLQNAPIAEDDLVAKLTAISQNGYDQRIFVRGDKAVDY